MIPKNTSQSRTTDLDISRLRQESARACTVTKKSLFTFVIFSADVDKKFETYQKFISIVIRCHRSADSRVIVIENLLCLALYFVPLVFMYCFTVLLL